MTDRYAGAFWSLSSLQRDLKYATRMIMKSPLFTGIVVLTLALGIGLNTAVFSAVEAMLLRPLPGVQNANELAQLYRTANAAPYNSNSVPHFMDVRARTTDVFSGVAAWAFMNVSMTVGDQAQVVFGQIVSANFFSVYGVNAGMGRVFTPDEDEGRGAHPVTVLSYSGWRSYFGGDPDIVGKDVMINGQKMTIIGVTPEQFDGPMLMVRPVMWFPLMQLGQIRPGGERDFDNRGNNYFNVIARLKPGVSVAQANARLSALLNELRAEEPDQYRDQGINLVLQSEAGIHPTMRGAQVGLSAVVMTVVLILLIISCVNVANLFLARSQDRAREMAIRLSLGARRLTLVRQLLVESILFSVMAGVAGMFVAWWTIKIGNSISLPIPIDFRPNLQLSPMVLGFAFGITVVTGVLFGLAPALNATKPSLIPALKGEAPAGSSRSRTSKALVVSQMALSIILLVSAGLFLANLQSATSVDKGFGTEQALVADLDPALQGYSRGETANFYAQLLAQLSATPGVESAALIEALPLGLNNSDRSVVIPGYVPQPNEGMNSLYTAVSPGYFATMGIPVTAGREFALQDDSTTALGVVVNARFAERFWPNQNPLGKTVTTGRRDYTVIGVVPTGKYRRLGEEPTEIMYFAQAQLWRSGMSVVVRTSGDPIAFTPTLRKIVAALNPNIPVSSIRTLEQHLGISLLPARIAGTALGVFGLLGLLLASVGMYGVMAYTVSQRTREIGIRMAIGASARDVIQLIMRQGLTLVLIGSVIGLVGAFSAARLLSSVLYGGNPFDPKTFVLVPVVLIGVTALATFIPARQASAVDPAVTIRSD
jgi:predicted permease